VTEYELSGHEKDAKLVGVDKLSISLYENSGSIPAAETLLKMANVFDVTLEYF
jgi:transcriptional regulator with XRE-family HTH domain